MNAAESALVKFNLQVKEGETVLLTGQSGCGKTTVIRGINGLIPHFFAGRLQGTIRVAEMDVESTPIQQLARKVGSVFQDPRSQFFTLDVMTELAFPGENFGLSGAVIRDNMMTVINDLELYDIVDRRLCNLSNGEKQKVAIASVYTVASAIFVLDEPSSNLDGKGIAKLQKVLAQLKSKGYTIIISEHRFHYLAGLADRVVCMAEGKVHSEWLSNAFFSKSSCWFEQMGLRMASPQELSPSPVSRSKADGKPVVMARDICFSYNPSRQILTDISLTACAGEIIGIVGQNGVGKSSLVKVLLGLKKQTKGTVYLNNRRCTVAQRLTQSFYCLQEADYQLFAASVDEEMLLGLYLGDRVRQKAANLLCFFGLDKYRDCHPATLSGGQKQRLTIALSCMRNTGPLYFDEPTSGLDGGNMRLVSSLIRNLADEGRCVFVISHDYEFMLQTVNKVIHLTGRGQTEVFDLNEQTADKLWSILE